MNGGHHLSTGIERSLPDPGTCLLEKVLIQLQILISVVDQGAFCRFANGAAGGGIQFRVGAQAHCLTKKLRRISVGFYYSHFVLGQGPCFVGTDNLCAA